MKRKIYTIARYHYSKDEIVIDHCYDEEVIGYSTTPAIGRIQFLAEQENPHTDFRWENPCGRDIDAECVNDDLSICYGIMSCVEMD